MREFADEGVLNTLDDTLYPTAAEAAVNPLPGATVYPEGWNSLVGFVSDALSVLPALAGDAVNFAVLAFVLRLSAPLSCWDPCAR